MGDFEAVVPTTYIPLQEMNLQEPTPREEALLRSQIQIMRPEILPLRVIFVPHWKYVDNSSQLTAQTPASDIAAGGKAAISVSTPAP